MNQRLGLFGQFIEVAKADGNFSADEHQAIKAFAKYLNIGDTNLVKIMDGKTDVAIPNKAEGRFTQFYQLILLANADGDFSAGEEGVIKNAALLMGLDSQLVDAMFEKMKNSEKGIIPHDQLVGLFVKFQN